MIQYTQTNTNRLNFVMYRILKCDYYNNALFLSPRETNSIRVFRRPLSASQKLSSISEEELLKSQKAITSLDKVSLFPMLLRFFMYGTEIACIPIPY